MTPQAQLAGLIARYSPEVAAVGRGALTRMRKLLRGANELVYDNYNALVIGYATTDRTRDAFCSVALYPLWVRLFFLEGAALPDPGRLLEGTGKTVRSIRLESARTLDQPAVRELIEAAAARRRPKVDPAHRRQLIIKSIVAKQRPRRPRQVDPS